MMTEDRIQAVAKFGFTERQARFLVTVMLFGGVCVPRQYAHLAGTAYGHKVNAFFDKLVQRKYATASRCIHNRARLYHVQHRPLYEAIDERRSRYRLPVPAARAIGRVMRLDSVLCYPELRWLATEREKVAFCTATVPSLASEKVPHTTIGAGAKRRVRLFPHDLPIGLDATDRPVFLYLVTGPFDDDFRAVLQRYGDLLGALPRWTVRLLFPRQLGGRMGACHVAFRNELATPLSPTILDELRWYFAQLRLAVTNRTRLPADARFRRDQRAFGAPRFRVLYLRWMTDGEAAFDVVTSRAIIEGLADETGRVESEVLLIPYRHLSPLANRVRSVPQGVEERAAKGAARSAHPQPLPVDSTEDISGCARDWYRLIGRV
jgi:hypothetical protein